LTQFIEARRAMYSPILMTNVRFLFLEKDSMQTHLLSAELVILYFGYVNIKRLFLHYNCTLFNSRALIVTLIELNVIVIAATSGGRTIPNGTRTPAATGIAMTL
jgi:hypothetical protein